jgi:aspartate beta-hydroxylase
VGGAKDGVDSGDWHVLYIELNNIDCAEAQAMLPQTMAAMQRLPRRYGHTFVSAMAPGTHISTHTGPTNKKLRVHLPLVVPAQAELTTAFESRGPCMPPSGSFVACGSAGGKVATHAVLGDIIPTQQPLCRLRAGPDIVGWHEGQALVFDDSFQHEAWNDHATEPRLVLIVDVWHPDLTDAEVKLLETVRSGQLRSAKALSRSGTLAGAADFYAVLEAAAATRGTVDERAVFPSGTIRREGECYSADHLQADCGPDVDLGARSEGCATAPMSCAPVRDD